MFDDGKTYEVAPGIYVEKSHQQESPKKLTKKQKKQQLLAKIHEVHDSVKSKKANKGWSKHCKPKLENEEKEDMAVLKFTVADALQTKVVDSNIYPCQITKIEGPKASQSGKGYNYYVDIEITDGDYKGKIMTIAMATGNTKPSNFGGVQYFPYSHFLQIEAAIRGGDVEKVNKEFDTDSIMNKPFDCQWNASSENGHLTNTIGNFYPSGYGKDAPAF